MTAETRRAGRKLIPLVWLGASIAWLVIIVMTDLVVWPLTIWIATTLGALTFLRRRNRRQQGAEG
jgi:Flp pilus assembly protein TadB